MKLTVLALSLLLLPQVSHSYSTEQLEKRLTNALECTAVYMIATNFKGPSKAYLESLSDVIYLTKGLTSMYLKEYMGKTPTNGDLSHLTSLALDDMGLLYDKDPRILYSIYADCDGWRNKMANAMQKKQPETQKEMEQLFVLSGDRPFNHKVTAEKGNNIQIIIDQSMIEWGKMDRITPERFKKELKDSLNLN